jgi:hypothetical protein
LGRALRSLPPWLWLTAIVVGSTVFRALLARDLVAPFILVDELIWSEVARGIADAGEPLLRDQPDPGYSVVYPLVIAPVYALLDGLVDAYAGVKTLNALVMSLAAVPAYFLARRVVGPGLALLGALLAVALPSLVYTGTVMTENVFYPVFLTFVLVLVLLLEQPTPVRVALLVGLLGLAFGTRVQAAALVPAVLLAPLVLAVLDGSGLRTTVRRYVTLYGTFAVLGALGLAAMLVTGRSPLGAYERVGDASYEVGEVLRYLVWHVAELGLYLLVIPVAATIVLICRARSLDRPLQALLAATVALTACLVPVVAAFASVFSDRVEERNLFYLAPLFVIALLAWVDQGAPRPRVAAPVAAGVSALLVLGIPFDRLLTTSAITDTLMLLPFWSLQDRIGESWITPAALLLTLALAAAFLLVPRRYAIALPLVVLALWAVALKPIWSGKHGWEQFSRGSLFQGIKTADRDWVDQELGRDGRTAFLWTGLTDRLTVNISEFFNRSVGPVYYVTTPTPGELPETRVTIDRDTGEVTLPDGSPVTDAYILADSSFTPDGVALGSDEGWGVTLWRVRTPLVSAVRIDGLYPNDTWSGETVTYLRRRCEPGRLAVVLSTDASLFLEPQTVVAEQDGRVVGETTVALEGKTRLEVPVAPPPGSTECVVRYTVSPTAVPAEVTAGENPDERELGAHFERFVYTPLAR